MMYDALLVVLSGAGFLLLLNGVRLSRRLAYPLAILTAFVLVEGFAIIRNGFVDPFVLIAIAFAFPKSLLAVLAADIVAQWLGKRAVRWRNTLAACGIAILVEFVPLIAVLIYISMTHELQPAPERSEDARLQTPNP